MPRLHFPFVFSCTLVLGSALALAQSPAPEPPADLPTFKVEVQRLLVPVVVRDAKGHVIEGLKQEDFQVWDNGKPRPIAGFATEHHTPPAQPATPPAEAKPAAPPAGIPAPPPRFVVFLFDDMHMSVDDVAHAQKASTRVMNESLAPTDIAAVVSISGKVNTGLTRDHARLQAAIQSLQPRGLYRATGSDCPSIDYYQADLIENKRDEPAMQDAIRKVFNCNPGLDTQRDHDTAERLAESAALRADELGRQDVRSTYGAIAGYVRSMSKLPGQRTLVLVSPGFLSLNSEALTEESQTIDLAAQAGVIISALDARGLYTTELSASDHSPGLSGGSNLAAADFRRSAMTQGESPMASMAAGTGGSFFHNSNDLHSGFAQLTELPAWVYVLELSVADVKPDGSFHHLKVAVNRPNVQLEARQGYSAAKQEKHKK